MQKSSSNRELLIWDISPYTADRFPYKFTEYSKRRRDMTEEYDFTVGPNRHSRFFRFLYDAFKGGYSIKIGVNYQNQNKRWCSSPVEGHVISFHIHSRIGYFDFQIKEGALAGLQLRGLFKGEFDPKGGNGWLRSTS